jgi:histidinol phosphatase-like enzyme
MAYQKYIILDRDGVINVDLFDYVTKSADFKFEDGSLEALSILSENNYCCYKSGLH